jgi:radical SAM protein with 4Fe4S-binding SPASM domain
MNIITLAKMWFNYVCKRLTVPYYPFKLWIEPTSACNLRCIMCPQSLERPKKHGYMEIDLFRKVIDEAKDFVHDINVHHTGESLLHPRLAEMISYAEQQGIYTKLHTNATLLDSAMTDKIIQSGLSLLSFSFDGCDAETYEGIRKGARFDSTLNNIIKFLTIKKEQKLKKPYVIIEIIQLRNTTPQSSDNYNIFIERFKGLSVDEIRMKKPHNWAGNYELKLDKNQFSECTFPYYALVVNWNGMVTACPQDYYCDIVLGDMNVQTLKEIWNGSAIKELRRRMKNKDVEQLMPCRTCDMIRRKKLFGIPIGHVRKFLGSDLNF